MKEFSVRCTFEDRKLGPGVGRTIKVEASSVTVAIGKASREFWKSLTRKERFDAMKSMRIEARRTAKLQHAPAEVYEMLDRAIRSSR
jgi:hypothetical protein